MFECGLRRHLPNHVERSSELHDVAVDHRLLALLKAALVCDTSGTGDHCNLIRQLARGITRPNEEVRPEEINFTPWLSQPASTGGTAAVASAACERASISLGARNYPLELFSPSHIERVLRVCKLRLSEA